MEKSVYTKEMDRRLYRLYKRLSVYFETGRDAGVSPALFSVLSYCWCRSPRNVVASSEFKPLEDCYISIKDGVIPAKHGVVIPSFCGLDPGTIVPAPGVHFVAGDNIVSDDLPF